MENPILENHKIAVLLFGAAYTPTENSKIQGVFQALE